MTFERPFRADVSGMKDMNIFRMRESRDGRMMALETHNTALEAAFNYLDQMTNLGK